MIWIPLQAGEIVGISITLLLLLLIVMVVVGVLVLKVRLISWKANERLVELMEFKTIQSVEALKSIQPFFLKSTQPLFYNPIIAHLRPNVYLHLLIFLQLLEIKMKKLKISSAAPQRAPDRKSFAKRSSRLERRRTNREQRRSSD